MSDIKISEAAACAVRRLTHETWRFSDNEREVQLAINAELDRLAGPLVEALEHYERAICGLGRVKDGKTLFELSPTRDKTCCDAWLELNVAGQQSSNALATYRKERNL